PQQHCCLLPPLFSHRWSMPMMAAVAAGDFTAEAEGFKAAGSTIALGISAPCSGSEASTHRFGGVIAIPSTTTTTTTTTGITTTIPTIGITATIPAPAITATIPTIGYRSQSNARRTWYYCSDPAGYYPSVTHCNTVWEYGPASAIYRDSAAPPRRSHV